MLTGPFHHTQVVALRALALSSGIPAAGAYTHSHSPYGTFDQGGNVWEWNEALFTLTHGPYRGVRGGAWNVLAGTLHASRWGVDFPAGNLNGGFVQGFRVASIPEQSSLCLLTLAALALLHTRQRRLGLRN
jgi:formylglycine-generating enzyme required for sulfatase activity